MSGSAHAESRRLVLGSSLVLSASIAWCFLVYAAWEEATALQVPDDAPVRRLGAAALAQYAQATPTETRQPGGTKSNLEAAKSEHKRFTITLEKPKGEVLGMHLLWDLTAKSLKVVNVMPESRVAKWNAANPSQKIDAGDLLVSINGVSAKQQALMAELKKTGRVELTVEKRSVGSHITSAQEPTPAKSTNAHAQRTHSQMPELVQTAVAEGRQSLDRDDLSADSKQAVQAVQQDIDEGEYSVDIVKHKGEMLGLGLALDGERISIARIESNSLVARWNKHNVGQTVQAGDQLLAVNGVSGDWTKLIAECQKVGPMTLKCKRHRKVQR